MRYTGEGPFTKDFFQSSLRRGYNKLHRLCTIMAIANKSTTITPDIFDSAFDLYSLCIESSVELLTNKDNKMRTILQHIISMYKKENKSLNVTQLEKEAYMIINAGKDFKSKKSKEASHDKLWKEIKLCENQGLIVSDGKGIKWNSNKVL